MKPTFSPESTAELEQAVALMERAYYREAGTDASQMTKLSLAIGEVLFVAQSTSKKPEALLPADHVRLLVMEAGR